MHKELSNDAKKKNDGFIFSSFAENANNIKLTASLTNNVKPTGRLPRASLGMGALLSGQQFDRPKVSGQTVVLNQLVQGGATKKKQRAYLGAVALNENATKITRPTIRATVDRKNQN
ncbi:hypothetical protein L596_016052 [Steinernema carpocapsae]|uniref:Uncharacterized protein n=1 Tax=Steinernema carpocapsae TaxID=34508 RepID=A0A4U5NHT8_STECR|nr:hypothetical protein L596_016052 [Steinernema carpocapsae]